MKLFNKAQIRKMLLQQRFSLTLNEQEKKAYQLALIVIQRPEFIFSRFIAGYWPNNGEINPLPLIHYASTVLKKCCYLPVLNPYSNGKLQFVEYREGDPLFPNRFGILEPKFALTRVIPNSDLDLVMMPLVAFDPQGNRLGMGGGYYDKTFSFLKSLHKAHQPYLLGLAYEFQRIKKLPAELHDIPLNGIATEKRYQSTQLV